MNHNLAEYHVPANADVPRYRRHLRRRARRQGQPAGGEGPGRNRHCRHRRGDRQRDLPCDRQARARSADHDRQAGFSCDSYLGMPLGDRCSSLPTQPGRLRASTQREAVMDQMSVSRGTLAEGPHPGSVPGLPGPGGAGRRSSGMFSKVRSGTISASKPTSRTSATGAPLSSAACRSSWCGPRRATSRRLRIAACIAAR